MVGSFSSAGPRATLAAMDSARSAGRGVGPTMRTSLLPRVRLRAFGLALLLLSAALPATALPAPGEHSSPAVASGTLRRPGPYLPVC